MWRIEGLVGRLRETGQQPFLCTLRVGLYSLAPEHDGECPRLQVHGAWRKYRRIDEALDHRNVQPRRPCSRVPRAGF